MVYRINHRSLKFYQYVTGYMYINTCTDLRYKPAFMATSRVLDFCAEGRWFDPWLGQDRRNFSSPVTFGAPTLLTHMCIKPPWVSFPVILVLPEDEFQCGEGECHRVYVYKHLYCLAVQAGFYGDVVECWIFVWMVAGSILGQVRTEDIFLPLSPDK